jgi:hypothetical protein
LANSGGGDNYNNQIEESASSQPDNIVTITMETDSSWNRSDVTDSMATGDIPEGCLIVLNIKYEFLP